MNERRQEWKEWSNYVLEEIKDIKTGLSEINTRLGILTDRISTNKVEIAKLQVRSSLMGGIAGAIAGVLAHFFPKP